MEKDSFFKAMSEQAVALTYDDVLLQTGLSDVSPAEVDIKSRFSRNVKLNAPLVSAAMDTVTESSMAIAMAKLGGLGVIHAGLEPNVQAAEVKRVKHHLNGLIEKPITVKDSQTISQIKAMRRERNYDFMTFPVVNDNGRLMGLLTQNDFDFCPDDKFPARDVMTAGGMVTAPEGTSIARAYEIMMGAKKKTLPLIRKDGTVAGMYIHSDVERVVNGTPNVYNLDMAGRLRVAAAVPTDEDALVRVEAMKGYVDVVVVDSAQGDSRYARQTLVALKDSFPNIDVVVGNITNPESAKELVRLGADGIKVGQGGGSICTTRIATGVGTPQLTAVYDCAKAIRGQGVPICADGGITNAGDVLIALGAGAHSVMMGSKLAGTDEAPGEIINLSDGSPVKLYRGMGSPSAIRESAASRKRYGGDSQTVPLAEGVESHVPYKGSVFEIASEYIKAIRKGMSYIGTANLEDHRQNARFVRVTPSGLRESHPHDVKVI